MVTVGKFVYCIIFRQYTTIYQYSDIIYTVRSHYGNMLRPYNGHLQANREHTQNKVSTQWDPIECSLYYTLKMFPIGLKMTVIWSKHVAVMWPDCIYNITVLIYCCVLTEYNTYTNLLLHNRMASVKKGTVGTSCCDTKNPWILIHILYICVFSTISDYKHYFLKHYLLMYVYRSYTLSSLCGRKCNFMYSSLRWTSIHNRLINATL